jgi:hypothetical protein
MIQLVIWPKPSEWKVKRYRYMVGHPELKALWRFQFGPFEVRRWAS